MIRFLNLDNQIIEGEQSFAFFNTVSDQVLMFDEEEVFYTAEDFIDAWRHSSYNNDASDPISRFTGKIPSRYYKQEE